MSGGNEMTPIVIDNGSEVMKAGFAGEAAPRGVFPSLVGTPRYQGIMVGMGQKDSYIGHEAQRMSGILNITKPIRRGCVTDWGAMEKLWHHIFYHELGVAPEDQAVVLMAAPFAAAADRERMTETMFETFSVPSLWVACAPQTALSASGRATGVVLDCGGGVSCVAPIYKGNTLHGGVTRLELAGFDLTDSLMKMLTDRGYSFTTAAEREIVRSLKEELCYVAADFDQELSATEAGAIERLYPLPDGQVIVVSSERFGCPEALFRPHLVGVASAGIHEALHAAIMACDEAIRDELYANIVLGGGSTMFPGFADRLKAEVSALAPPGTTVCVIAPPDRGLASWIGASQLASSSASAGMWISRQDYDEHGPSIVHRKCPA